MQKMNKTEQKLVWRGPVFLIHFIRVAKIYNPRHRHNGEVSQIFLICMAVMRLS